MVRIHRQEMRAILETGLKSGDPSVRQKSIELVNRLVACGELDFRDLVSTR